MGGEGGGMRGQKRKESGKRFEFAWKRMNYKRCVSSSSSKDYSKL